ncbi:autotransporter domain-containing protein, partial [Roseomonas sp. GC11]|uniref:autotransporter outer membrane beta-barrel domain-containing protein n=1 Tax=Roseomonas sp. GC11 TaxID=2950546 RepID=UPI00210ABF5F
TTVSGGTLALSGAGDLSASSGVSLTASGAAFDIAAADGGRTVQTLNGVSGSSVALGANTLTVSGGGGFAGVISGTGGLTAGGGTLTLSAANGYTGLTTVSGGTLALSGTGDIATSSGVSLTASGTVFDLAAAGGGRTVQTLNGVSGSSVALGDNTLTVSGGGGYAGSIGGPGGLTVTGGTLTLSGANGYTGATRVEAGTLALSGAGDIAASSGVSLTASGTVFDLAAAGGGRTVQTLNGVSGSSVALGANTLTVSGGGGYDGVISGTGGLTASGGTLTLSAAQSLTGAVRVEAGTLALSGAGDLSTASGLTLSASGAAFTMAAANGSRLLQSLNGVSGSSLDLGAHTLTVSGGGTYGGAVSGPGGLTVTGGTLTLSGANSYTGVTRVEGGTLALSGTGTIATSAGLNLATSGAGFSIAGASSARTVQTLDGVAGSSIALGAQQLRILQGGIYSGTIAGTGGLEVAGGSLTLNGVNSFTGLTTVSAGTLVLGDAGHASARIGGSAGIVTGARLTGTGTVAGSLTNSGLVVPGIGGAVGTLTVGGNYVQSATGTLQLALTPGGASALAITGGAVLDGALAILPAAGTYAADSLYTLLTATGGVTGSFATRSGEIAGMQLVTIYRANQVDLLLASLLVDQSKPIFTQNDPAAQASAIVFSGGTLQPTADATFGQPIVVNSGNGTVDTRTGNVVFTGSVSGDGNLTTTGSGSVEVAGGVSLSGTVVASEGTLYSNSTLQAAALEIEEGATLRGSGVIDAPTTVSGTLSPGNSPGTLTFTAPVVMTDSSTFEIDIDGTGTGSGAGNYSRVIVDGASFTAAGTLAPLLRGITGSATNTYTPEVGTGFRVVEASSILGSFSGLTQPAGLATGTRFDALYQPTSLTLYVTPESYARMSALGYQQTANQLSVGRALDALRPAAGVRGSDAIEAGLAALFPLNAAQIQDTTIRLGGAIYGDAMMALVDGNRAFGGAISGQQAARRANGIGAQQAATAQLGRFTSWIIGLGQTFNTGSEGGATAYHASTGGVAVGLETDLGTGFSAGIAAGYTAGRITSPAGGGRASPNVGHLAAYGGYTGPLIFADAQVSGSFGQISVDRDLGALGMSAHATPSTSSYGAELETGVYYRVGHWTLQPGIGARVDILNRDHATESGAGVLGLNLDSESVTATRSIVGLRASTALQLASGMALIPAVRLQWAHEFGDVATSTGATLIGASSTPIRTETVATGRDRLLAGLGASLTLTPQASLFLTYSADLRSNYTGQAVSGGLLWSW